ncbi:MAG: hypothetical protein ACI4TW_08145 [Prevotella sp.]
MIPGNKLSNLLLGTIAGALVCLCVASLNAPQWFASEQKAREKVVRERLDAIANAEKKYKADHGNYCSSLEELVHAGYMSDSLRFIPFSDGATFSLTVSSDTADTGYVTHSFECGAHYRDFLKGLDANSVSNLVYEAETLSRYPGLYVKAGSY